MNHNEESLFYGTLVSASFWLKLVPVACLAPFVLSNSN